MRGHLRKTGERSWSIVLDIGRDPETGKRWQRWITVKGTKRDAERKQAEVVAALDRGEYVEPSSLLYGEYLRQWLRDYGEPQTRARTLEGYAAIIDRHLIPKQGRIRLKDLSPSHLQAYYAAQLESGRRDGKGGLSPMTIRHHHRLISETLHHAVRWGLVSRLQDLRHTHASLLPQQGVHPKVVRERLGHTTITTTMDLYSHVMPGMDEAAIGEFDANLRPDALVRTD